MSSFPTTIVSPTDPTSGNHLNSPDHAQQHQSHNAEIVALETKLGTGASTPASNTFFIGNGTGTSAFSSLTSAQLISRITDETGTGSLVFGTSPTIDTAVLTTPAITTPKITTSINDSAGNEVIKTPATASAVNEFTITNQATGTGPQLSATGNDSNIDIQITPKGTGKLYTDSMYPWQRGSSTWTYASATTMTVPTVDAALMTTGTKIWLTQTTSKYFNVISISGTTITITGGIDYTLANAVITAPYFSNMDNAFGHPGWYNYTATTTGYSADPTNLVTRFRIDGKTCTVMRREASNGTSNATTTTFTAPVAAATITNASWRGPSTIVDNGVTGTTPGIIQIISAASVIDCYKNYDVGATAWTNSGSKRGCTAGQLTYEIA